MRVVCKNCKKFFFETKNTVILENYQCPRCKEVQNIKVVTPKSSEEEIRLVFDTTVGISTE